MQMGVRRLGCLRMRQLAWSTAGASHLLQAGRYSKAAGREAEVRPSGFWLEEANQKEFLDELAEKLGVKEPEDWKKVKNADVLAHNGRGLLQVHRNSLFSALQAAYGLDERVCRSRMPRGYWENPDNRRAFMDDVARAYGVEKADDWQHVGYKEVLAAGGRRLMNIYDGSVYNALKDIYPEANITVHSRPNATRGYWKNKKNCRAFMDLVAEKHGVTCAEEWLRVPTSTLQALGGGGLLRRYSSFMKLLGDLYPEYTEEELQRCRRYIAADHWEKEEHVRQFMEKVKEVYRVEKKEDWYRISNEQLARLRGAGLVKRMRLIDALRLCYPDEEWSEEECTAVTKRATQRMLYLNLRVLFGDDVEIIEEYRSEEMRRGSGTGLELDFCIPAHKLAFEYNGRHHYDEIPFFGSIDEYRARDERKQEMCDATGLRLVTVPYWWDQSHESLAAAIHSQFPGVLADLVAASATTSSSSGE